MLLKSLIVCADTQHSRIKYTVIQHCCQQHCCFCATLVVVLATVRCWRQGPTASSHPMWVSKQAVQILVMASVGQPTCLDTPGFYHVRYRHTLPIPRDALIRSMFQVRTRLALPIHTILQKSGQQKTPDFYVRGVLENPRSI